MCDQQNLNELFNDSILPQFRSWINFLTEISPHEVSWDEHRSDAESVKILYNYSIELSKYADRINGCSGILKFGVNPDEGKLVLKQAFFCRVRHCPVCQWRRSLLWRAVMFQQLPNIQERFPTHRWVFLTLTVKNPPVTELRDTLKHMNDSWKRLIETKRFKSGVAGFLRTTEVTRGNDGKWWHIRIFMPCYWLSLVTSRLII